MHAARCTMHAVAERKTTARTQVAVLEIKRKLWSIRYPTRPSPMAVPLSRLSALLLRGPSHYFADKHIKASLERWSCTSRALRHVQGFLPTRRPHKHSVRRACVGTTQHNTASCVWAMPARRYQGLRQQSYLVGGNSPGRRGAMHDARGMMHVARGTLHDARGMLHVARGTLHVARGTLHVARGTLHDARCTLHVARGASIGPNPQIETTKSACLGATPQRRSLTTKREEERRHLHHL
jgi:tetraspanin-3